jgi:hypothetical protein
MDPNYYGLIEMLLSFGVVLAICFWQLRAVSKAKKARLERERQEREAK